MFVFTSSLQVKNCSLKDVLVIAVQHLTPTTLEMFQFLVSKNLDPKNIFILGKCYSTNPEVYDQMLELGFQVSSDSFKYDSFQEYDTTMQNNIEHFVSKIILQKEISSFSKVIVMDDGGSLLSAIRNRVCEFNKVEIIGIEQTSSGYAKAKKQGLKFPTINVARSFAKLNHETPFVSRMLARKTLEKLSLVEFFVKRVLIIGSGYIGKSIASYLKNHFEVDLCDRVKKMSQKPNLNDYQAVIGCTGEESITYSEIKGVNNNIALISASSSDREFPSKLIRQQCNQSTIFYEDMQYNKVLLVNSGFPINFGADFLDSEEFLLTRSLLLQAIFQAASTSYLKPKFQKVRNQDLIIEEFQKRYPLPDSFYIFPKRSKYETEISSLSEKVLVVQK